MTILRRKIILDHHDFTHHIVFVAGTGAGKTTFARNLTIAVRRHPLGAACFFIDPKGIDALTLLEEVELDDSVIHLDPARGFSFNPLALPPYHPEQRDQVVSLYIGHFRSLIESWYRRGDVAAYAPRMIWLFESILSFLYRETDEPTFGDIVAIAHLFLERDQAKISAFLSRIEKDLCDRLAGRELVAELQAIREMPKDAWFPILTRISRFATDPFLSRIFNVRRGNVNILNLLEPGRLTVIRAAGLGDQVLPLFIAAIVLGIWFNVRYRQEILKKQNLVVVIGDELHTISSAIDLDQMLSQARAFDLGLAFFLQFLDQAPLPVKKSLLANCHTQIVGRVSGEDADEFLSNWGVPRENRERYKSWMTSPPPWKPFTVVVRDRERNIFDYDLPLPPQKINKPEDVERWILGHTPGFGEPARPIVADLISEINEFERYLPERLPSELEWRFLLALEKPTSFYNACTRAAVRRTTPVKEAWESLIDQGWIIKARIVRGAVHFGRSKHIQRLYFEPDFSKIAKTKEGQRLAELAWQYHLNRGDFVVVAPQRLGEFKVDMIAHDYDKDLPIAIEVESASEIKTHAEQVAINIKKFKELGFAKLELWFPKALEVKMKELVKGAKTKEDQLELFPR